MIVRVLVLISVSMALLGCGEVSVQSVPLAGEGTPCLDSEAPCNTQEGLEDLFEIPVQQVNAAEWVHLLKVIYPEQVSVIQTSVFQRVQIFVRASAAKGNQSPSVEWSDVNFKILVTMDRGQYVVTPANFQLVEVHGNTASSQQRGLFSITASLYSDPERSENLEWSLTGLTSVGENQVQLVSWNQTRVIYTSSSVIQNPIVLGTVYASLCEIILNASTVISGCEGSL